MLTYIAEGYTSPEIAEALVISVKTVDRHRENIMRKLNLHNRVELVKYAIESGRHSGRAPQVRRSPNVSAITWSAISLC